MAISLEQFQRFFAAAKKAGTQYACPFCGSVQFEIATTSSADVLGEFTFPTQDFTTHSYYILSCKNCGHTDGFNKKKVDQWLAINPSKES